MLLRLCVKKWFYPAYDVMIWMILLVVLTATATATAVYWKQRHFAMTILTWLIPLWLCVLVACVVVLILMRHSVNQLEQAKITQLDV